MKLKNKYNWYKLPNGKFSILGVPIFSIFEDKKRGKVDKSDASKILENFQESANLGYYPRVHIEHQAGQSQPGAGFIDNLKFDGKNFIADLVEIPKKIFEKIKALTFPYRSVEFDRKEKKITSLALLESQAPFFEFPLLALSNKGGEITSFQKYLYEKRKTIFQKGKIMPEEVTEEITEEKLPEVEGGGLEERVGKIEETLVRLEPVLQSIPKILQFIEKLDNVEGQEIEQKQEVEPVSMQKFQDMESFSKFLEERDKKLFSKMDERLKRMEVQKSNSLAKSRLKEICEANPDMNFKAESEILEKFSSYKDKTLYIDKLEAEANKYEVHQATHFARNFSISPQSNVLQNFSKENVAMQKVARIAYRDYKDTINQTNERAAEQFSKSWPDAKMYIEHAIELEKSSPGKYKETFFK